MKNLNMFDIVVSLEQGCSVLNLAVEALTDEIANVEQVLEEEGMSGYLGYTKGLIPSFYMVLGNLYDLMRDCSKLESEGKI